MEHEAERCVACGGAVESGDMFCVHCGSAVFPAAEAERMESSTPADISKAGASTVEVVAATSAATALDQITRLDNMLKVGTITTEEFGVLKSALFEQLGDGAPPRAHATGARPGSDPVERRESLSARRKWGAVAIGVSLIVAATVIVLARDGETPARTHTVSGAFSYLAPTDSGGFSFDQASAGCAFVGLPANGYWIANVDVILRDGTGAIIASGKFDAGERMPADDRYCLYRFTITNVPETSVYTLETSDSDRQYVASIEALGANEWEWPFD